MKISDGVNDCQSAIPSFESDRLAALRSYEILDTPTEPLFDGVARLASTICQTPIAVVNFVGEDRQWFKAEVGIGRRELPVGVSICRHAILQEDLFVVPDLRDDDRFARNPLVDVDDGLRFYAGALLTTPQGFPIGTVCVLDREPRPEGLTETQADVLRTLARQVMGELELRRAMAERNSEIDRVRVAENLLRESETRLQLALGAARAVAWEWNFENETIRWGNLDAIRELAGPDIEEVISFGEWLSRIHPDDVERHLIEGAQAVAAGRGDVTFRFIRDGDVKWLRATGEVSTTAPDGSALAMTGITQDITERMLAEGALREREQQLSAMFSQATAGFAQVDLSGRFTLVNDRFCEISGRSREELQGLTMQQITHEDDLPRNLPLFEAAVNDGTPYTHEKRYVLPDGGIVWVSNSVSVIRRPSGEPYGVLAVTIDVTERRMVEAQLQASQERLRIAMAAGALGDWDWDARSDVVNFSEQGAALFGVPPGSSLTWKKLQELIEPADAERAAAAVQEAVSHRADYAVEYRVNRNDGTQIWVSAVGRPLFDHTGEAIGMIGMVQDVTHRHVAQAELRHLNETLEQRVAAEVAERSRAEEALRQSQKLESMGQLTGGVAHDFNNLLTPIIGGLDMLQRHEIGDQRTRRLIDGALQSAERAKTLVQRLLAFARRQPLQPTSVDLRQTTEGMMDLISSTVGPRIRLSVEVPPELPPVYADNNQLEMALLNLSVNARDAMPEGGELVITASVQDVSGFHRSELPRGTYVLLAVRDTGCGMDEATIKRAIEPFFSTKGIGQGTGLGLSMVHGLVAQLGGSLSIVSMPTQGTTVELWLPIGELLSERKDRSPSVREALPVGTALLVDDEEWVRASTASMLGELGYDVVEVSSAEEALSELRGGLRVSVIVTDHLMPGMTGTELVEQVRREWSSIPALIVSGYAEDEGIALDFPRLTKPFRQAELATKLFEILN